MKKFSVLAAAAAFVGSFTNARMLQDQKPQGDTPKCCTLLSGDPNGKRTEQRICERLMNEEMQFYVDQTWTGEDLAELGLTNISGYKCDKDAHLEFCQSNGPDIHVGGHCTLFTNDTAQEGGENKVALENWTAESVLSEVTVRDRSWGFDTVTVYYNSNDCNSLQSTVITELDMKEVRFPSKHKVTPVPSIMNINHLRIYDVGFGHSEDIGSIKIEGAQLIGYYGPYYWFENDEEHRNEDLLNKGSKIQTYNYEGQLCIQVPNGNFDGSVEKLHHLRVGWHERDLNAAGHHNGPHN